MPSGHDFYTGLVARLYAPLRSVTPDPAPYAAFIAASGEPALELGCGDGDPILDLRARGLDVEGLDSSAEMLERCREEAVRRGLDVTLHHQPMETMSLTRTYRSIYLAGPTFNLLLDDTCAAQALERIRAHLTPGGSALIPLFIPRPTPPHRFGQARESRTDDGTLMRFTALSEARDEDARRQVTAVRYELRSAEEDLTEDRSWALHWYGQSQFAALAGAAGLNVRSVRTPDGKRATPDAELFTFRLTVTE